MCIDYKHSIAVITHITDVFFDTSITATVRKLIHGAVWIRTVQNVYHEYLQYWQVSLKLTKSISPLLLAYVVS